MLAISQAHSVTSGTVSREDDTRPCVLGGIVSVHSTAFLSTAFPPMGSVFEVPVGDE